MIIDDQPPQQIEMKICARESVDLIEAALTKELVPKIAKLLAGDMKSFVVEFQREATMTHNTYSDFAYVSFKSHNPIIFAAKK